MESPIKKFKILWEQMKIETKIPHSGAVCVSTINKDGFPSGRFVDLKGCDENGFTFCTSLDSQKGQDIELASKVSLTFWWSEFGYQVRVLGEAKPIATELAQKYWHTRQRDAQLTTLCSQQSKLLESGQFLTERFKEITAQYKGQDNIPMPSNWGGYTVRPVSIEFLTFRDNRLHLRELFTCNNGRWTRDLLQP